MRTLILLLTLFSASSFAGTCGQDIQFVQLEDALNQMAQDESLGNVVKIAVERICSNDAVGKTQSLREVADLEKYLQGQSPMITHALEQIRIALAQWP